MVAGAFAFVPVEQASTVHTSGTVSASGITPVGAAAVGIASAAGAINAIAIGNDAQADTIAIEGALTTDGNVNLATATDTTVDAIIIGNDDAADTLVVNANTTIDCTVAFNGAAPDYTVTNPQTDRAFDANATVVLDTNDVIVTIIDDLIAIGLFQ